MHSWPTIVADDNATHHGNHIAISICFVVEAISGLDCVRGHYSINKRAQLAASRLLNMKLISAVRVRVQSNDQH